MKNTTTPTTTTLADSTKRVCLWNDDALLEASFMFPTKHFKDADQMKKLSDKEFCQLIEEMLKVCQPIDNENAKLLCKGVLSGNRLRMYYQATTFAEQAIEVSNDLKPNLVEIASMDDEDLHDAFEGRGFQVMDITDQDQRRLDDEWEGIQVK